MAIRAGMAGQGIYMEEGRKASNNTRKFVAYGHKEKAIS